MEVYSESYKAKCIKKLKEWGAPLDGWECLTTYDVAEDADYDDAVLTECELCGCQRVRYVHVMRNPRYFEDVEVGCICAGIMEGNILAAKERERQLKNRAKRKLNFPNRKWKQTRTGGCFIRYRGKNVFINRHDNGYYICNCNGETEWQYKRRPIKDFLSACYAAFDLADPQESEKRHA